MGANKPLHQIKLGGSTSNSAHKQRQQFVQNKITPDNLTSISQLLVDNGRRHYQDSDVAQVTMHDMITKLVSAS